jgi:membrane-bound serine protease (ClpP class)
MDWWVLSIVIVLAAALTAFIVLRILDTYQHQPATGKEELKGKTAVVREMLAPEGTVVYQGDLWNAVAKSGTIEPGEEVIISEVEGLTLIVTKKAKE